MTDFFALATNLENSASTQYTNYNFNSFCTFKGMHLGAGDGGIFRLDQGDDDNGTDIAASFQLVTTDFGIRGIKRIRALFIGYEVNGNLLLTLKADQVEATKKQYTLTPRLATLLQHEMKLYVERDIQGNYWSFKVANVEGCDFSVDSISALLVVLAQHRGVPS